MARKNDNCPHANRPHHALGMCKDCYSHQTVITRNEQLKNLKIQLQAAGPPPAPIIAKPDPPILNTFDEAVVNHCVRAIIACQMDIDKAAHKIASSGMRPETIEKMAIQMRADIRIQTKLQHDLSELGLDDDGKKRFIAEMTRWLYNESDPRLRATAARVFAKAFIAERIESKAIEELPIQDFKAGLDNMLSDAEDPKKETTQ